MTVNTSCSDSNIKIIKAQFNEVIKHSQGITEPQTDKLFEMWFEAKRDFIEAWNGQMIFEVPGKITFELSQKDKDSRLDDFINSVSITFDNDTLAEFLEDNRAGFFQNKVIRPWYNRDTGIDIPEGMKLIKAFKYFETDEVALKDLQTQASMIIQEDKIEGVLCFSVHPLDFLSSSENTYKWRSCHALDGEYRAGNLSYMVDKATIMCYLRGAENAKLPNFPSSVLWNSKKWRMLLFFSEKWDVLFAGRQYPFFSRSALDTIMNNISRSTLGGYGTWSQWHDDQISTYDYKDNNNRDGGYLMWPYICIANELYRLDSIVKDGKHSLQFNDVLRSSCYKPYFCFKYYKTIGEVPRVNIGGAVPCLRCGGDWIVAPDTVLCEDCELDYGSSDDERFGYCDCCDRRIIMSEGHYIGAYGQVLCDWCYDSHIRQCDECGYDYFNDDIVYNKTTHSYLCSRCNMRHGSCQEDQTTAASTLDPVEIELKQIEEEFNDSLRAFIQRLEREAVNYNG